MVIKMIKLAELWLMDLRICMGEELIMLIIT